MKWPLTLITVAVALSGCQSQSPPTADPFFGRTRVPPPGTGNMSGPPTDPYFGGTPSATGPMSRPAGSPAVTPHTVIPQTPGTFTPGTSPIVPDTSPMAPGMNNRYTPPAGTFDQRNGSGFGSNPSASRGPTIRIPPPSLTAGTPIRATPEENTPVVAETPGPTVATTGMTAPATTPSVSLAGRERIVRILQPRPKPVAAASCDSASSCEPTPSCEPMPVAAVDCRPREPRLLNVPVDAIDIRDLPKVQTSTSPNRSTAVPGQDAFRLISGVQPSVPSRQSSVPGDSVAVVTAAVAEATESGKTTAKGFAPKSNYGYGADYAWLRGRLEYSRIDQRWKLRYIPIDGETDRYGGSVVLPDQSLLSGFERGDFIEARGQIDLLNPKKGFAPTYRATAVKRL